ncbi:hypothetical protein BFW38_01545 [Terasakiispira papahanaumokuakeensis]|uniref:Bifunctional NAD(P)H-hydrate repair enzyme n=1 Tax=Terasakiispira papahanaumokuakeensis TaxID=197479 RepID=A0A1E2V611_9GAMM|nr:bifunctional ADP-dependent NAD(P)H-hydrate dehydratase/NAD(P)H-hydrate epimerase [Terasakiispira papahanaumokuakeensis]ODC02419.1 hypothetical protein BFW38_01545 [Terasakiispira papahanaumokuakeensis]
MLIPLTHLKQSAPLWTAEGCQALDRHLIASGVVGFELMCRAGRAAWALIQQHWSPVPLSVFCGAGNNGGDGLVVAALAHQAGWPVRVVMMGAPEALHHEAAEAWDMAERVGVASVSLAAWQPVAHDELIIDALLGIGVKGAPRAPISEAIEQINDATHAVIALDAPSGLNVDTGHCAGECVRADMTITFIAVKPGLLTGQGPAVCGPVWWADLNSETVSAPRPPMGFVPSADVLSLPQRQATAHKGDHGHVLLLGGDHGMGGAVILAAQAALRSGAGLVRVLTRSEHVAPLLQRQPEVMVEPLPDDAFIDGVLVHNETLDMALDWADTVVIGPGLGRHEWGREVWRYICTHWQGPMVADADALYWWASGDMPSASLAAQTLMTPHPGEAARLLGMATRELQQNRFEAVEALLEQYHCGAVILKGAGSVVGPFSGAQRWMVCPWGNPGMATGGTGDVLSGICGALSAQGIALVHTAMVAVGVHARAGDCAAQQGQRGLVASDLIGFVRHLLNDPE